MKRVAVISTTTLAVLAVLAAATVPARAGDFEARVGYYFDADEVGVGFGALAGIGSPNSGWYFNPNVVLIPGDFADVFAANVDFHYDFATASDLSIWAGGGPAILVTDRDRFDDNDVDAAVNAFLGAGSRRGAVRPFFQLTSTLKDDPEASLAFGLRF